MGREVAVLRAGRLAQTATPTVLYRAPVDLDVARFVGDAVVAPGNRSVRASSNARSDASRTARTSMLRAEVEVMIRPEQIRLARRSGGRRRPRWSVHGYFGPDTVLQLRLRDDARSPIAARTFDVAVPDAGDVVGVGRLGPVAVYPLRSPAAVTRAGSLIALAACCRGPRRRLRQEARPLLDHPLQRPARRAHERAGRRVREEDRRQGPDPDERLRRSGRPDHPGGRRLAGRRLHRRELARADGAAAARAPRPAASVRPRRRVLPATTPRPANGSAWRCGSAVSSTTRRACRGRSSRHRSSTSPGPSGRGRSRSLRRIPTSRRSSAP